MKLRAKLLKVSKGRKYLFARDYVKALCGFLGNEKVKKQDVDLFYKVFWAYLKPFNELQFSKDLESGIEIQAGSTKLFCEICAYNDGVTKQALAKNFKVGQRNIQKYAVPLVEKGLIRKDAVTGRGKKTKYYMSDKLEEFFKSYRANFA